MIEPRWSRINSFFKEEDKTPSSDKVQLTPAFIRQSRVSFEIQCSEGQIPFGLFPKSSSILSKALTVCL